MLPRQAPPASRQHTEHPRRRARLNVPAARHERAGAGGAKSSTCPERPVPNTCAVRQRTDGHSMPAHLTRGWRRAPRCRRRTRNIRTSCDGARMHWRTCRAAGVDGECTGLVESAHAQCALALTSPSVHPRHPPKEPRTTTQRRDLGMHESAPSQTFGGESQVCTVQLDDRDTLRPAGA